MSTLSRKVAQLIQQELIEAEVYRVDFDRVDVAPRGSSGILRGLALTGNASLIAPGDPVKLIDFGGKRVALAQDGSLESAIDTLIDEGADLTGIVEGTWETWEGALQEEEKYAGGTNSGSGQLNDGWVFLPVRLTSTNWNNTPISSNGTATAINFVSEFGVPSGTEAVLVRVEIRDSGTWGSPAGQNYYFALGTQVNAYTLTNRNFGNDIRTTMTTIVPLDADGNAYWISSTSGTGTMDVLIDVHGYKLPTYEMGSGGAGWIFLNKALTSTSWDGDTISTTSTRTAINAASVFGVPSGATAIILRVAARDTASSTYTSAFFGIWTDPTDGNSFCMGARPGGIANNSWSDVQGVVTLSGGNFYYTNAASGVGTMSVYLQVYGYYLGEDSTATGWVFFDSPAQSPNWNPAAISNNGTAAPINFLAEFNLPPGTKAAIVRGIACDTGSAAATDQWFGLQSTTSPSAVMPFIIRTNGLTNNARGEEQGIIPLDPDGNAYWKSTGCSGTNSMSVWLRVVGYLLPTDVSRTTAENLQGYVPDNGATASAHIPVTDANGYLNTTGANLANLNVSSGGNYPYLARSLFNMTGGGTVQMSYANSTYYFKWSQRFIVISSGRASTLAPSGYFDITMPTAGTVITGYGGAASQTVDATYGIPMPAWYALYYELPLTSTNISQNGNFRLVAYTADFMVPPTWVLIAVTNGDGTPTIFCTANGGYTLAPSLEADMKKPSKVGINYVIDGGGAVISAGTKGAIVVPGSFLVDNVQLLADVSGSATVTIYYGAYSAYNASMSTFGTYSLSAAQKNSVAVSNALVPEDYILRFDVSSVTSITRLTVAVLGFRGN